MQKADAIIVLGRGIDGEGNLPLNGKKRVEKAVELWREKWADYIIMSGKWYYRAIEGFPKTESLAMKEYAISLGVPAEKVLLEEESTDTLSNAYFTKVLILEPKGWKNVIVISSDDHMIRSKYNFEKALGPEYTIEYVATPSMLNTEELAVKQKRELQSLKVAKRLLSHIQNGDTAAIKKALWEYGPGYNPDYEGTLKKLDELFEWANQNQ